MFGGSTIDLTGVHDVDDVFLLTYSQNTIVSCIVTKSSVIHSECQLFIILFSLIINMNIIINVCYLYS